MRRSSLAANGHGMWRRARVACTAALAAVVIAACGSSSDDGSSAPAPSAGETSAPAAAPRRGGTLTYIHNIEPRSLDVIGLTTANQLGDGPTGSAIYDVLVYEDRDTAKVEPRLAESFTTDDGLTWTLKLRPGIKFSDGTPLDAEAVKKTWERLADPANRSSVQSSVVKVKSTTVVDDLTLRVVLDAPNGQFDRVVARTFPFVASPAAVAEKGERFAEAPVGAGPFMVKEWLRGDHITLVRNPNYWDAPRPYLDELVIRFTSDIQQSYNTFKVGQADILATSTNIAVASRGEDEGFESYAIDPAAGGFILVFNTARPPFDDVRARRAVTMAIDRDEVNKTLWAGDATIPDQLINAPSPFADPSAKLPGHDRQAAQALLDQLAAEKGRPLEFTIMGSLPRKDELELYQAQLSRYRNIVVRVEPLQPSEVLPKQLAGDFDLGATGAAGMDPEPDVFDSLYSGSARNYGKYSNADMDRALLEGRSATTQDARMSAYKVVQSQFAKDLPFFIAQTFKSRWLLRDSVRDFEMSTSSPRWDLVWLAD